VDAAAVATSVPLDIHGMPNRAFTLEGRAQTGAAPSRALSNVVTPDYFAAMGIPMREGPGFAGLRDTKAPPQAVVNEEFVRRYIQTGEAIGRTLETRGSTFTIVGVARQSVNESFGEKPTPLIYLSYRDRPSPAGEIHLRTRAGAELLLGPQVERVVRDLDPTLPVYDIRTLSDHVEKNLVLRRIPARMFVVLGPLLLGLAAIGIYAVVSYAVARRTREIGVRLTFGATSGRVVLQIIRENLAAITQGTAIGWLLALAISFHVMPNDPVNLPVFLGVPAILLSVATLACWIPARRASRIDPMEALRHE
jgi:ABC-type antimicrobial peptide transport system permease subunit